jgi:hypothetical protein
VSLRLSPAFEDIAISGSEEQPIFYGYFEETVFGLRDGIRGVGRKIGIKVAIWMERGSWEE